MPHEQNKKTNENDDELDITPVENNTKDDIQQPKLSEEDVIPRINTSNLFIGGTGGGKSTLVNNFVVKPQFFGGKKPNTGEPWFDWRLLISPTGDSDDVQTSMGLSDDEVETDLSKVPDLLRALMKEQKKLIKEKGADKAPNGLIMYDDIISHPEFMKNKQFIKTFIANRHHNFTVFISSQSWTKLPRAIRLQAKGIFFFEGSQSEQDKLCDEYCPPGLSRHDFREMIKFATRDDFAFLFINKSVPMKRRFRKNLKEILTIDFFKDSKNNPNFILPEQEETQDNEQQKPSRNKRKKEEQPLQDLFTAKFAKQDKKRQKVITSKQHGVPGTVNDRPFFRRRNFERRPETGFEHFKQKPQNGNFTGSRRIESSYFT